MNSDHYGDPVKPDDVTGRAGEPWQTTTAFALLLVVAGWALLVLSVLVLGSLSGEPADPTTPVWKAVVVAVAVGVVAAPTAFGVRDGRAGAVPPAVCLGVLAILGGVAETVNWPWSTGADGFEPGGIGPATIGGFIVYGVLSPAHRRRARTLQAARG